MKRTIKKAAVIGSGVMGSRIACHFANIGLDVVLLDIVPRELNEAEKAKGKTLEDKAVRNRIVDEALQTALKSNPSPIYRKSFANRIKTGNLSDDLALLKDCDWIIEAVTERLDIKKLVYADVEKYRKPGSLITSNTSGIPIGMLIDGRSDDFKKNFCGTHFFNPPRYLKLLEIIPSPETSPEVLSFFEEYGQRYLGKVVVHCKDTPAFIANRVGVYSIQALFHLVKEMGLTVEEVDKLTGPVLGRPKSATFRTCDVVGLDTLVHVAKGVKDNCPNDEASNVFSIPDYVAKMVENNWIGDKTKQGFYKKTKNAEGKTEILSLDLNTLEYGSQKKAKFATLEATKPVDDLRKRIPMLLGGKDKAGEFYRKSFAGLFAYVSNRIPEISDNLYSIDDAMKAGFGWQLGSYEVWDIIGVEAGVKLAEENGHKVSTWVKEMLAAGISSFYKIEDGKKFFYDIPSKAYKQIPAPEKQVVYAQLPDSSIVWQNSAVKVHHLGEGILCCSWSTKMNTIGGEVIAGLNKAVDLAEKEYKGLILYNEGENFSAGANVGMIFMMAAEQDYDELNMAIKMFQNTVMRMRYSSIPVVGAPHNLALGGGCEISMHWL